MRQTQRHPQQFPSVCPCHSPWFITFPLLRLSCQLTCTCSPPPVTTPTDIHLLQFTPAPRPSWPLPHTTGTLPYSPICLPLGKLPQPYRIPAEQPLRVWTFCLNFDQICGRLFFSLVLLFGTCIHYRFCSVAGYSFYLTISWVVLSKPLTHTRGKTTFTQDSLYKSSTATLSAGEVPIKLGSQIQLRPENISILFHNLHKHVINWYNQLNRLKFDYI